MILAIGMGVTLEDFGQEHRIGWLVSATIVREMGALMTAFILAASLGSGVAAEIGTMKVSEEIDALEVMSISPVRFLIVPRVVALVLICPVMTIYADVIGILGGAIISSSQFGVSLTTYRLQALDAIALKDVLQSLREGVRLRGHHRIRRMYPGNAHLRGRHRSRASHPTSGRRLVPPRAGRRIHLELGDLPMNEPKPTIEILDVHKGFGSREILRGLDLTIAEARRS